MQVWIGPPLLDPFPPPYYSRSFQAPCHFLLRRRSVLRCHHYYLLIDLWGFLTLPTLITQVPVASTASAVNSTRFISNLMISLPFAA
jgi:hypothetical protein